MLYCENVVCIQCSIFTSVNDLKLLLFKCMVEDASDFLRLYEYFVTNFQK